jgi:hypothetical protein
MGGTQAAATQAAPQDVPTPDASGTVQEPVAKADRLIPGQYFAQPTPMRPAQPEEPLSIDGLVAVYRERDELLPAYVQGKCDGERVQIHRTGDTVKVLADGGRDVTARLPSLVAEVRKLKADPLVLDAELARWQRGRPLPGDAVREYLKGQGAADDGDVTATVFDVLWRETDLHREPLDVRLRALAGLGLPQRTMAAPSSTPLNEAPAVRVTDLQALERAVRGISKLPGAAGAVIKQAESDYPLEPGAHNAWAQHTNTVSLRGIVHWRRKAGGDAYVLAWGLAAGEMGGGSHGTIAVDGRWIVPIGETPATARVLAIGQEVHVEVEGLVVKRGPKGVEVSAQAPRVLGTYSGRPDTVEAAIGKAQAAHVLCETVEDGGAARYLPRVWTQKAVDPYLTIPPEDERQRFVVQNHWRGKSLHADVRLELRPNLLVGWTLNTQIPGVVEEPVTTLDQAEAWRKRMAEVSRVDWTSGKWAERGKGGRVSILSEMKGPHPHAWLSVEGASKPPKEGEPPPPGATRNFPAVYSIEDSGTVEWGAQKPWLHEYFFHGDGLNYRVFWRLLQLGEVKKGLHSHERCMQCEQAHPTVDVIWADGRGRAWFCAACYPKWLAHMGGRRGAEVVRERQIVGPAAPAKFGEVHKAVEVSKAAEPHPVVKALPPGAEPDRAGGRQWLAVYPEDPVPYVLSNEAVGKAWMPPVGVSALPAAVRSQIPKEFRYWHRTRPGDAKTARDALHEAIKGGKVKVDWQAPYGRETRKAVGRARWVLHEQTWQPLASAKAYWLRLDLGTGPLVVLRLYGDPRIGGELEADCSRDRRRAAMAFEGEIRSRDGAPSEVTILDRGSAEVVSLSSDSLQVRLKGSTLSGLFGASKENGEWRWAPAAVAQAKGVAKQAATIASVARFVPVLKVDKAKRLVTGVVLEPGEIDAHRDIVPAEVVERAAHRFLARFNSETRLGLMHKRFGDVGLELVESWLAPSDMHVGGEPVKEGTWLMTVRVVNSDLWEKVKRGQFTGFSIGGIAKVPG